MSTARKLNSPSLYHAFERLNGDHPLKKVSGVHVEYQARRRKGGKVRFFNFELAKEMGLIDEKHSNELNAELEKKILETFSLVIINEWDIENNIKFPQNEILPQTFMATRYLQLQHPDKLGRTSGDGRTIWNGTVEHKGTTWDISSCGTGGTRLSPACNINKQFYQTGDPTISYGCGYAEVAEGMETLIFSEVLHQNQYRTERLLTIIEFEKGISINVRAYPNLLRPSHFFAPLKQGKYQTLKELADYHITREIKNKRWPFKKTEYPAERYYQLAEQVVLDFSSMVARFEDEYIFCWLDWDGDNILMDGGIIDYGSIRQFGLFHSEYRFDDVERFSTTILEQKQKAKYIAQCFVQMADFLASGKKKSLQKFKDHRLMKLFDKNFEHHKNLNLLKKIGFDEEAQKYLVANHIKKVENFRKVFSYFERAKSKKGLYKVADGITQDAIFCMRDILREFPQIYMARRSLLEPKDFLEVIRSSYAKKSDLKITPIRVKQIKKFQEQYLDLVSTAAKRMKESEETLLMEIIMRSSVINKYDRVTGNSISFVVDKITNTRPKLTPEETFIIAQNFKYYQTLDPDKVVNLSIVNSRQKNLLTRLTGIVRENRESL
ncbi:MAG TPA: hypothetical protein VKY27_04945 [Bacteriovoracaceae bacterium]|nr:hypothetical protein [Bacteriovoracaceae bacterium]